MLVYCVDVSGSMGSTVHIPELQSKLQSGSVGGGMSTHPGVASGRYASSCYAFLSITDFVIHQVNRSQNGLQPQIDLERRHDRSVETDAQPKRVLNSLRI